MENEFISEAMNLCFKGIMDKVENDIIDMNESNDGNNSEEEGGGLRSNVTALLLRCLGSIVHHSDALLEIIKEKNGAHPFASIPILTRPNLLHELKQLVTMDISENIRRATGIPPHIEAVKKLDQLVDLVELERAERKEHFEAITKAVGEKIEELAMENGTLTRPAVERLFQDFGRQFETHISKKIDTVIRTVVQPPAIQESEVEVVRQGNSPHDPRDNGNYPLYFYDGQHWQVPFDFALPTKTKRKQAWELWLCGMTTANLQQLCPFRFFKIRMLPKHVKNKFKVEWQPILQKMMDGIQHIQLPEDVSKINSNYIDTTFMYATNHLKENVCSFLWQKKNAIIENWNVATWSSNTQRANILKHGNEKDIGNLPAATRYNNPHRSKRNIKRKNAMIYDHTQENEEVDPFRITQQEAV